LGTVVDPIMHRTREDLLVRNLRSEADSWIRNMESGCYPRGAAGCDSELKAEVVLQIRDRLAKGSQPIRRFLDQHAMAVIVGDPALTREYVALIDATRRGRLRAKLDEWAIALWERFPVLQVSASRDRISHVRDASETNPAMRT
jgi:hypothetical protein